MNGTNKTTLNPVRNGRAFLLPCTCLGRRAFVLPFCNAAPYKHLQRLLFRQCSYIAKFAKQRTGLCSGFSCGLPHSTATDTRPAQAAIIPPVPRWSTHTHRNAPHRYQIPPKRRTLYRSTQLPYYNNVYKGAGGAPLLWIHARQCNRLQIMQARRGHPGGLRSGTGPAVRAHRLAPSTRRAVQQQGCSWRRGTIGGSRRISFRAFAR